MTATLEAEVARLQKEVMDRREEILALKKQLDDRADALMRRTSALDRLKGACMAALQFAGVTVESTGGQPVPGPDQVAAAVTATIAKLVQAVKERKH